MTDIDQDLSQLLGQPLGRQILMARNSPRLRNRQFLKAVLDRAFSLRHSAPAQMLELAVVGTHIARATDDADAYPYALAHLGNALKCNGRFTSAVRTLRKALSFGPGAGVRATILEFQASSLVRMGRAEDARIPLCEALDFRRQGPGAALAACLLLAGQVESECGDPEEAALVTCAAIDAAPVEELGLRLAAYHNICKYYLEMNEPEEASELFSDVQSLYRRCSDFSPHREHMAAMIQEAVTDPEAEARYVCAVDKYRSQGLRDQAAVAALQRLNLLRRDGRAGSDDVRLVVDLLAGLELSRIALDGIPLPSRANLSRTAFQQLLLSA